MGAQASAQAVGSGTAPSAVTASAVPSAPRTKSGFIIGPVADFVFIIGAPLVAVLIAGPSYWFPKDMFSTKIQGATVDLRNAFIISFVAAHLVLVFFRSHGNANIFWTHPIRFTVVPLALLVAAASSRWILACAGVVAVWWDVYHSSLQTFGFGRIYDAKQGNSPEVGRKLDIGINLFLYLGPVLAGAQFAKHIAHSTDSFAFLKTTESPWRDLILQQAPTFLNGNQRYLTIAVLSLGIPFLCYYLLSYYRLYRQGYHVSWQKVSLLIITGCVSTYFWGFRSFIDAFWVMNFFHAWQYFAIVFFAEGKNLTRLFRADRFPVGTALVMVWVVALTFMYGYWAFMYGHGSWFGSAVVTISIMHFWYDSFIWSVRRKQV
jgi:hypothetical protein